MAKKDQSIKIDYEVGYQKPPKATRFVKGQSGNPSGRPKGKKNWATALHEALEEKVTIVENGKKRQVTKLDAAIKQMINQAATGDKASMRHLMQLVPGMEAIIASVGIAPLSSDQDKVVLEEMLKRLGGPETIEIRSINDGHEGV